MLKHHFTIGLPDHSSAKTLVIMGVARGGTSMVAGTVRELGINLGKRLGENHEDPEFLPHDLDKLRSVIEKRNTNQGTWGWKMPHSIDYIATLEPELRNPHFIFVWRNSLAAAVSQVRRSDADIHEGLRFSVNRLSDMVNTIGRVKSPSLLINYERATAKKDEFIDTLAAFLGIDVSAGMRANCHRFIDPGTGYKQVSETYYDLQETCADDHPSPLPLRQVLQRLAWAGGRLVAQKQHGAVVIREQKGKTLPADFVLVLTNHTDSPSRVCIKFDFDWKLSHNLAQRFEAKPGRSAYRIRSNGALNRILIEPTITDGVCDIGDIETRAP